MATAQYRESLCNKSEYSTNYYQERIVAPARITSDERAAKRMSQGANVT